MMRRMASVTIKDVARRCGVHASTVSRVLNPSTRAMVSVALAERVLRAADRLGYRRNPLASGLRTRRSYTIGVLIPDLTNPVFPPIVRGVERTLSASGFIAILADSANDQRNEQAMLENLQSRQIDGLILATAHRKDPVVAACIERSIPLVLVNRSVEDHAISAVVNDDELGIRLALEHLIALGHRKIAYVGGPQNTSTGYARYRAFRKVARALGIPLEQSITVNARSFDETAGAQALDRIFGSGVGFSAVVAANDLLALGCCDAIASRGLNCPRDVSVTGFNDMPFVGRCNPPLTTVHIQHDELGVQAARLLLQRISEPQAPATLLRLAPHLVVRGSTRPALDQGERARARRPSRSPRAKL
jgi:LacI family transcriptional regulator, galactose operon repressor